ncbi:hypothetical protein [Mycoplasmopsis cynos]|uniref:hypothetical protein n=1 Tax=Mycoplasmopsis cynos TaxID=171284 RepID=UPI0024C6CCBB|nr:hypothetical protein [Mycoplasmopsis cynos]WAM04188.1 hypothetical protein ONA01_03835 [Mycoplasmopsis cynos]
MGRNKVPSNIETVPDTTPFHTALLSLTFLATILVYSKNPAELWELSKNKSGNCWANPRTGLSATCTI